MRRASHLTLAILASAVIQSSVLAQQPSQGRDLGVVTMFHGTPGAVGSLVAYDEARGYAMGGPSWFQDIQLLDIDVVGRTLLEQNTHRQALRQDDIPSAARILLPRQRGSVYHYRRLDGSSVRFGFFVISGREQPLQLLELTGIGTLGDENPFLPLVSTCPRGAAVLVASRLGAGGDLFEINVRSGSTQNRTQALAPQDFSTSGFWLGTNWGFGLSSSEILRFDRQPGSNAAPVPFAASKPDWFSQQAVMSPARKWALTTAGTSSTSQLPYAFGRTGPAVAATDTPADIATAGFLPDEHYGPYMAISDTGLLAGWCVNGIAREAHIGEVELVPTDVQVTGDMFFTDTLDEVGQMNFFQPDKLNFSIGEFNLGSTFMEKVDVFGVGLDTNGQTHFENRTLSSGDADVPFLEPGTITAEIIVNLANSNNQLIFDDSGKSVIGLKHGATNSSVLLNQVKELFEIVLAGDQVLLHIRSSVGDKLHFAYRTNTEFATPVLVPVLGGSSTIISAVGSPKGQALIVWDPGSGGELLSRINLNNGEVTDWQSTTSSFSGPITFTPSGGAAFSQGLDGGQVNAYVWRSRGGHVQLQSAGAQGFILP